MPLYTVLLLAVALSMDAFAVAVASGCALRAPDPRHYVRLSACFGFFQFLMAVLGWYLGLSVREYMEAWDHWIAFALLAIIGINMLREALNGEEETTDADLSVKTMFLMAVATSIDALAVGISLAMAGVSNIFLAVLLIGVSTVVLSAIGVRVGNVFGSRYEKKAELMGGVILILLGVKILLEHLGVI